MTFTHHQSCRYNVGSFPHFFFLFLVFLLSYQLSQSFQLVKLWDIVVIGNSYSLICFADLLDKSIYRFSYTECCLLNYGLYILIVVCINKHLPKHKIWSIDIHFS